MVCSGPGLVMLLTLAVAGLAPLGAMAQSGAPDTAAAFLNGSRGQGPANATESPHEFSLDQYGSTGVGLGSAIVEAGMAHHYSGGLRYRESWVGCLAPLRLDGPTSMTITARGVLYDYGGNGPTYASPTAAVAVLGSLMRELYGGLYGELTAGWNTTRRAEVGWYPGGSITVATGQPIGDDAAGQLSLTYYGSSAGTLPIFAKTPSGFELAAFYTREFPHEECSLAVRGSAYQFDTGTSFRGYRIAGSFSVMRGLLTLRGERGYDGSIGNYYSLGAALGISF